MATKRKAKNKGSRVMKALKKYVKKATSNPKRVKGAKVKGGRSVSLTNFTGRVIRKRNGQVQIIGRVKKR
jgi:hypothetical protein